MDFPKFESTANDTLFVEYTNLQIHTCPCLLDSGASGTVA